MIVSAECMYPAFDNGKRGVREPYRYTPGPVPGFDTEVAELNNMTTVSGEYIFQYPGHEGKAAKETEKPAIVAPVDKRKGKRTMSDEARKAVGARMLEGRIAKKAALMEAASE